MNDAQIEQEIQAKGLTAPRVTQAEVEAAIVSEHYFTALQGARCAALDAVAQDDVLFLQRVSPHRPELELLTFCVLVLRNGFTVTGESACASPENFDAEIGRKIARQNAVQKVWALEGYLLKDQLWQEARGDKNQYEAAQQAARLKLVHELMNLFETDDAEVLLNRARILMKPTTPEGE